MTPSINYQAVAVVVYTGSDLGCVGACTDPPFAVEIVLTNPPMSCTRWLQATATDSQGLVTHSERVYFETRPRPPPNDLFANRIALTGETPSVTANVAHATWEPDGPRLCCGGEAAWWSWVAPVSATYTAVVQPHDAMTPALEVLTGGEPSTLQSLGVGSVIGGGLPVAEVTFEAVSGVSYYFAVMGGGDIELRLVQSAPPVASLLAPAEGTEMVQGDAVTLVAEAADADGSVAHVDFFCDETWLGRVTNPPYELTVATDLEWSFQPLLFASATDDQALVSNLASRWIYLLPPPPPNDDFVDRQRLSGFLETGEAELTGATAEPGEPSTVSGWNEGSAWWSWTAPGTGMATWLPDPMNADEEAQLDVYLGSALDSLSLIATASFPRNRGSVCLGFWAVRGAEYQIRLVNATSGWGWQLFLDRREFSQLRRTEETFEFSFETSVDRYWRIDTSPDLLQWQPVDVRRSGAAGFDFGDILGPDDAWGFYRVVPLP